MKFRFKNPWPHKEHGFSDILKWKLRIGPQELPRLPDAPTHGAAVMPVTREQIAVPPAQGWRVVWLGHASFLLQGNGTSLLIDPIFSNHCGPLPLPGLKRMISPPCAIHDLPPINAVLLTHSHYDHLDLPTLRSLGMAIPLVVAEGHACWLKRRGFKHVIELPWFESTDSVCGIRVMATPAQHFTARSFRDRNHGHWCGWLVEGADLKLWHAGDSGFCDAFREIGERCGPIDFGMIPIGAYQPRRIMRPMHMNPEEAVSAFIDARCRRAVAMHWGTFRLTDEPPNEPPILLKMALQEAKLPADAFIVGSVGDMWEIGPREIT